MQDILQKASLIRLVLFDVDGVLTDGHLYVGDDGQEYKAFSARDGLGIHMLMNTGVEVGIVTGNVSAAVTHRMYKLGVKHVLEGHLAKLPPVQKLCSKLQLQWQQVAYVGDDLIDIPVMLHAGLAIAVADAHSLVIQQSHWQTQSCGGKGAAREVCELLMRAQGTLTGELGRYGLKSG